MQTYKTTFTFCQFMPFPEMEVFVDGEANLTIHEHGEELSYTVGDIYIAPSDRGGSMIQIAESHHLYVPLFDALCDDADGSIQEWIEEYVRDKKETDYENYLEDSRHDIR